MAKQLNIDMNIRANTSSAQAELRKLKQTLDDAINSTIKKSGNTKLTSEITEATQAAAKLKLALENATNVKTGNLDLSKFSEELSKSKMNLKQYSTQLLNLGSTGEKAFLQMANAIASAEIPLRHSNGLLTGLWTTMKNTARWQLSSTALHGFLGAIQGAYGYAQKLNTSLNNIQIVTGQSSEQMAKFAEEANKSAKALSTTTTAYTDAALIYYQQGLSENEVKERTDATIKLANVSRQSAEEVSSQMTSIWNNFSKGGENLEYYADVITKLGATTASSSSEIADGLSKFAAVADTVGLSYEKASAALATVVAETRQSADVVGTAFRTLFARVEGLQLGKTLEDGVDLNKYSKALDTVGVKILDNNKQIKQMDTILDELGAKWNTIGESEQIALAQTVAGVRQYTQFMSLMNNYDKVQKNQTVAEDSEGTLQKQADIYAESWEAANKRVKAAAQGIYDELLNDKFFIGLNNSLAGILEGINKFIKSLGGIPGVLGLLGTVATTVFKNQIALSIDNAIHNLAVFSGVAQDKAKQMQNDMIQVIEAMNDPGVTDKVQQAENNYMIKTLKLTQQLSEKKDKLLEQDYEQLKLLADITAQYGEYAVATAKTAETADEKQNTSRKNFTDKFVTNRLQDSDTTDASEAMDIMSSANTIAEETAQKIEKIVISAEAGSAAVEALNSALNSDTGITTDTYEQVSINLTRIKSVAEGVPDYLKPLNSAMEYQEKITNKNAKANKLLQQEQAKLNKMEKSGTASAEDLEKQRKKVEGISKSLIKHEKNLEKAEKEVGKAAKEAAGKTQEASRQREVAGKKSIAVARQAGATTKEETNAVQEYVNNISQSVKADNNAVVAKQNYAKSVQETKEAIKQASSAMTTSFGQSLTTTFRGVSQLSMGLNSLKGMFETLNNEDMSFGEKFLSVTTSLGMAIPSLIGGFSNLKQSFGEVRAGVESGIKAFVLHIGAMTADEAASESLTFAEVRRAFNTAVAKKVTDAETTSLWADVVAKVAAKIATDSLNAAMLLLLAAIVLVVAAAVGLVAIFNAIKANSPEEKLKKAEENAKALAEAFEDAKNRAQELKDSFNKYNEIVNKLDSCVKGTEEWRDTLKEVNSQVLSLIEQYPELSKYVTTDSDGVMRISKEGQTILTDKANQAVSVAEAASVEANQEVRQKRMDVQASNMNAKAVQTIPGQSYSGTNSGTSSKNTIDASNMVKGYINENREKFAEMTEDQLRTNLEAYFDKNNISGNMDDWVTAAQELTKAVKEDTETTKAETKAIVSNRLADNKKVSSSTEFKEISNASSQLYDDLMENQTKKLKDDGWGTKGISKADGANERARVIWDEYLKAANLDSSKYKLIDTTGDDNNRKFVYNDENGEKKEVTLEQMRATKASREALKELDSTAEQITKDFQKLSVSTDKTDQALESFLANKDFESASAGEVADFSKFVNNGKANTESIQEYLTEQARKLGYEDLTSMAKEYGYKKEDEYVKAFGEKAVNISKVWEDDIDLEKMGLDKAKGWAQNLSSTAAKALSDNFDKIKFGPKGEKAAQEYIGGIGSMIEGLNIDDQKKALEDLTKIDWSGYDAFDEATTTMKKYGKTLDENDPKWDAFIANMRKANSSIPDFSSLNENLTSMSKILEKLNFGDIIEDGDYEKLIKYKDVWKEFFMMQADGTRKFIGDANEMKKATQESIREAKKDMEERKGIQDELNKDNTVNFEDWEKKANDIIDSKDSGGNKQKDKISLSTGVLSNTNVKAALNAQGYTEEDITRIVNNYNDTLGSTSKSAKDAKESMANLYKAIGDFSTEAINTKDQQEKLNEELASTATNLNDLRTMYANSEISADAYDKQLTSLAMTAKSLSELQNLKDNGGILDEESEAHYLDTEEYGRALMSLAESYENCTNEISEYQQALASGSAELVKQTQAMLENSIAIGEQSKALGLEAESVEEQAKELISVNNLSEENHKVATKVAILNQSMNKGVQDLVDNWKDYKEVLTTVSKGTQDYADTALKTRKALASLVGVLDEDFIPKDFLDIPGVMDLIDQAVKGDVKSINELGLTMAKATVEAIKFEEGMKKSNGVKKTQAAGPTKDGSKLYVEEEDIVNFTKDVFEKQQGIVVNGIQSLLDSIENGTLKAGESITEVLGNTTKSWIDALNDMAYATGMSVDEMNSLLNELGVQADVTVKDKEVETSVPEYTTYEMTGKAAAAGDKNTDLTSAGYTVAKKSVTVQTGTKKVKGSISVAQINTGDKVGTPPTITYAGRDNVSSSALTPSSSSSNSGSSSSTPTTKAASHTHEVNRYSNEENAIKGLSEQYDRLNKVKDKAFGKSRIQAIEAEIKHLKALKEASGDYLDAIVGKGNADKMAKAIFKGENIGQMIANGSLGGTSRADYNSLFGGLSASGKGVEYTAKDSNGNEWLVSDNYSLSGFNSLFGTNLSFSLDSYGNLQNKDAILNLLQNLRNNEADAYSRIADPSASSTTEYNKRLAYLEEIKERIEQYGSTAELLGEKADEYLDYISSIQEKNAEIITERMELGVNLGQKTQQKLDRSIKILGDTIYKSIEAMRTFYDATFKEGISAVTKQGDSYLKALDDTKEKVNLYNSEDGLFDENAIDPASAAELFSSIEDGLDGLIDELQSKIETGKEYYGNVLDYWNNKLENVNNTISNNIKTIEHLQNILTLLGHEADYELLEQVIQSKINSSKDNYESLKAQADLANKNYQKALEGKEQLKRFGASQEQLDLYDETVLQKAIDDFQSKTEAMYSSLEELLNATTELFNNNVNKIFQQYEKNLSGEWGNFDILDSAMQRQQSVAEEYLTKTNQLYETNTLLRKLSQDIDKTDNSIAKKKLKAFSDEIEAMQKQEKLSKTDLEIAKAKYEVLQAELALEDLKNTKTTVRLQRDSEGNYGYVYTSDQDKVMDAEQQLEDKRNALYNLSLKNAEEYGQKLIQLSKEREAEIQKVIDDFASGRIATEEERDRLIFDINEKYHALEIAYLDSYTKATLLLNETGAEGSSESWITSFDDIIKKQGHFTEESIAKGKTLTDELNEQMSWLNEERARYTEEANLGNEELKRSLDNINSSTKNLAQEVTGRGGLLDSMSDATIEAYNLSYAFINQYDSLSKLITKYSDAANEANRLYQQTVDLINVQTAYNLAKEGATSVGWSTIGSHSGGYYENASSGANGNNDNGSDKIDYGPSKYRFIQYSQGGSMVQIQDIVTKKSLWVDKPTARKLTGLTNLKSGGYTGTWVSGKTGMYTGSWNGPDIEENGKLAFLHQKELVLNADDTENVLSAVKLIRQISQTIDLQAAAQSAALQMSATPFSGNTQTLQQEVTIHAEFPNVQNHNEIEEAFNNLINRASQFANRN